MPDVGGSPVRAGIGPATRRDYLRQYWFPRASGDRPYTSIASITMCWVPPCERG